MTISILESHMVYHIPIHHYNAGNFLSLVYYVLIYYSDITVLSEINTNVLTFSRAFYAYKKENMKSTHCWPFVRGIQQ